MMNRDRVSLWARVFAIGLAAVFLLSSILIGFTATSSYNLLELFGGGGDQGGGQTVSQQEQIQQARNQFEQNPQDAQAAIRLGTLYLQDNKPEQAVEVLERGQKANPENATIVLYLGQAYDTQAQAGSGNQQELYAKAGDAYARYTELADQPNPDAYLLAGQAYENAGEPGKAIEYYNNYLDENPDGQAADQVRQRISDLLQGGGQTTGE